MGVERVERRLAAIVAVDVVGYSRLMGQDEEGTLAALRAIRCDLSDPKIKEHQGRIVKTMGDGLLIEFASVSARCAVRSRCSARWRNATPACRRTSASTSGSAFIRATSSSRTATSSATGSISPPVSKVWPNRAASASAVSCATRSVTSSTLRSTIWATGRSRTSRGRCMSLPSGSMPPRRRGRSKTRPCRYP